MPEYWVDILVITDLTDFCLDMLLASLLPRILDCLSHIMGSAIESDVVYMSFLAGLFQLLGLFLDNTILLSDC